MHGPIWRGRPGLGGCPMAEVCGGHCGERPEAGPTRMLSVPRTRAWPLSHTCAVWLAPAFVWDGLYRFLFCFS